MEKEIEDIIMDLLSGQKLTPEEQESFGLWMEEKNNREKFHQLQQIRAAIYASKTSEKINYEKSWEQLDKKLKPRRKLSYLFPYVAAAMMIGFGITILTIRNQSRELPPVAVAISQANPDAKQAVLILSSGQQVVLSDSLLPLTEQNGTTIHNNGNQLVYQYNDTSRQLVYNTVKVPRGGEYKLTLSDGSTIWINSESEITYPVAFSHHRREIQLKGEAFFEIHKDTLRPFIIRTEQFNIRVTGTQFNVRTYPNDIASATLAKGGIQLEKDNAVTRLVPGEQASLVNGRVQVRQVDVEEATAWRHEAFSFKQRPLESLLNEIARWYDIEIFYQNNEIRNYHFTAWFRRSTPLNEIIQILEKTQQVKLELKGKTLTVRTN